jgi:hypothetical protein
MAQNHYRNPGRFFGHGGHRGDAVGMQAVTSADSQDVADFSGTATRLALPLFFRSAWSQPINTSTGFAQERDFFP